MQNNNICSKGTATKNQANPGEHLLRYHGNTNQQWPQRLRLQSREHIGEAWKPNHHDLLHYYAMILGRFGTCDWHRQSNLACWVHDRWLLAYTQNGWRPYSLDTCKHQKPCVHGDRKWLRANPCYAAHTIPTYSETEDEHMMMCWTTEQGDRLCVLLRVHCNHEQHITSTDNQCSRKRH